MSIFTSLIGDATGVASPISLTKIKFVVGVIIICGALTTVGGVWYYVHSLNTKISTLEKIKTDLEVNNKILQENVTVCKDNTAKLSIANLTNVNTVSALKEERVQSQKAISNLAATAAANKRALISANNKLNDLIKDPKNDGLVAPALRETVRSIETSRGQ